MGPIHTILNKLIDYKLFTLKRISTVPSKVNSCWGVGALSKYGMRVITYFSGHSVWLRRYTTSLLSRSLKGVARGDGRAHSGVEAATTKTAARGRSQRIMAPVKIEVVYGILLIIKTRKKHTFIILRYTKICILLYYNYILVYDKSGFFWYNP